MVEVHFLALVVAEAVPKSVHINTRREGTGAEMFHPVGKIRKHGKLSHSTSRGTLNSYSVDQSTSADLRWVGQSSSEVAVAC